jgi:hypothetical protein
LSGRINAWVLSAFYVPWTSAFQQVKDRFFLVEKEGDFPWEKGDLISF